MHVIINILFYCKLRIIYGLKWTTTSKRSSPPRGREWRICLNMKVVKWVAAHTGMFIKRSVKTGKIRATRVWSTRFAHCVRFCCLRGDRMCRMSSLLRACFCFHVRTSRGPPPNHHRVCLSVLLIYASMICACFYVPVFVCARALACVCLFVRVYACAELRVFIALSHFADAKQSTRSIAVASLKSQYGRCRKNKTKEEFLKLISDAKVCFLFPKVWDCFKWFDGATKEQRYSETSNDRPKKPIVNVLKSHLCFW